WPDVRRIWRLHQHDERTARHAILAALRVLTRRDVLQGRRDPPLLFFVTLERESTPAASRSCGSACARVPRSARSPAGDGWDRLAPGTSWRPPAVFDR